MATSERLLDELVTKFENAAYAEATKSSYRSQLTSFLNFCSQYEYSPLPASTLTIVRYIAFLSMSHTYGSTKLYLNAVRLLHIYADLQSPLDNHAIVRVMKGVKRIKKDRPRRRPIMTINILKKIWALLNVNNSLDATFWAACLLAFYGMLRISSLFPPAPHKLCLSSATVYKWGVVLHFTYSKTVQFLEREPYVCFPWNADTALCPASALLRSWLISGVTSSSHPLLTVCSRGAFFPLKRRTFLAKLNSVMSSLGKHGYTGHSFRRGGATHALNCGVPAEVIQAQGDWKSLSYLDYLDSTDAVQRSAFIKSMY